MYVTYQIDCLDDAGDAWNARKKEKVLNCYSLSYQSFYNEVSTGQFPHWWKGNLTQVRYCLTEGSWEYHGLCMRVTRKYYLESEREGSRIYNVKIGLENLSFRKYIEVRRTEGDSKRPT